MSDGCVSATPGSSDDDGADRRERAPDTDAARWAGTIDTFLRSINHELRTPLTSVIGYAELLAAWTPPADGEVYAQRVDGLRRSTRRLAAHIDDLLDLARLASGSLTTVPRPVPVGPLARTAAAAHGSVTVDVPPEVSVRADAGHVERILTHLLTCATDPEQPDDELLLRVRVRDEVVEITVVPADAPRPASGGQLPAPFSRTSGPGLAVAPTLVRELATANGGRVGVLAADEHRTLLAVELPVAAPTVGDTSVVELLHGVIADGPRMLFQPVVDLGSGATVGYEALARGPEGSSVERPDRLFMAARSLGLLAELDWACRLAAGQQAAERGLRQPALLFVNIEPAVLGTPIPSGTVDELRRRAEEQSIVVEFTERDLLLHPARVLRSAEQMRRMGLRLALDDVGADPVSATFLPVLRPDVVKLDMQLVRAEPTPETARTLQSVRAYVEDSGAILLAEGIETDTHLERALAMGATLGQGYRFGRPAPLPAELPRPRTAPIPRMTDPAAAADTPFDLVARWESLRTSRKPLLVELSKGLERFAIQAADDVLLLAAFQQSPQFTPHTMQRYEALADRLPLVAALGAGLPKEPATGVRGVDLVGDDRMVNEWTVVVLGNHVAAALIAVDLEQDAAGEDQRRFQHVLTHDRATVTAAARCMLRRLDPA